MLFRRHCCGFIGVLEAIDQRLARLEAQLAGIDLVTTGTAAAVVGMQRQFGALNVKETAMGLDLQALKDSVAAVQGQEASIHATVDQLSAHEASIGQKLTDLAAQVAAAGVDPTIVADIQAQADALTTTATSLSADKDGIVAAINANPVP